MFDLLRRLYSPVVTRGTIAAPPAAVYDVLSDPTTYPDWLVGNAAVRHVDDRFPAHGAEFDHTVGVAGPLTIDDSTEAVSARRDHQLVLQVHAGPFHARVDFELRDDGDGGTEVSFAELPTGVFGWITPVLRPVLHARNAESMRQLRERVLA